ncbi:MAG: sensor histidine kinase, partial [Desulfobulbaceae bacterium]
AFRLYLNVINRKTAEDLARERVEAVQQVARSIAHEINNPLAILQNYLSILDHRLAGKPDIHEELVMFNAEISRIGNVCAQLDDLSGTPPPHAASPVDLGSLLQECLGLFQQSLFQHQKITSYLDVAPQLPTIPSNPDLLRQIFGNLLKNAAEALPVGGKVWLRCESIGHDRKPGTEGIRITIEDNGPGISPALAGKLFRAGVTDKDGGHLGIGLAIVKKLVTELGGSIDWCPRSGGGTCFTIDFLTNI